MLELAREGKLPADLKTEATTLLSTHPDRKVRDEAADVLPLPKRRPAAPCPRSASWSAARGTPTAAARSSSATGANSCGGCHRVQGQGQWVGPDLSTIGTKYGKDELLRSILNPSAAIGYNYRTHVVALADGRVLTGLAVEDTPDRARAQDGRAGNGSAIRPADIEDRKVSEVSLMPEGLAQTMSDQELVDLLAFLSTLRQPVSIVGQYHVIGPVAEAEGTPAFDPRRRSTSRRRSAAPTGRSSPGAGSTPTPRAWST